MSEPSASTCALFSAISAGPALGGKSVGMLGSCSFLKGEGSTGMNVDKRKTSSQLSLLNAGTRVETLPEISVLCTAERRGRGRGVIGEAP